MSFNVLVIPEDFRKDQYILKPILKRLVEAAGRKSVRIDVCRSPRLGSVSQALRLERIQEIINRYRYSVHCSREAIKTVACFSVEAGFPPSYSGTGRRRE